MSETRQQTDSGIGSHFKAASHPFVASALLLGSGFCALAYQAVWLRQLRLIFGASTAANAAVLAIFMGGLGLGGWVLGKRADRHKQPLALYGYLELGVACFALFTLFLISGVQHIYAELGGTPVLGTTLGTALRIALSVLVLGVPTFLMGGTLPAMVRATRAISATGRSRVGLLYAANTVGSVAGVVWATFFSVEWIGVRATLVSAACLNLVVAGIAVVLGRSTRVDVVQSESQATRSAPRLVLFASAVVGFAFLLMELVWYRMLAPILGGSSYSFGMILAVALAGIGMGAGAYAVWARRWKPSLLVFALTCALEAVAIAVPLMWGDGFALFAADWRQAGGSTFGSLSLVWFGLTCIAVFPAAFISGFQFPLLVALIGSGDEKVGRQVGQVYAWNTVGAIGGSLAGGFGLVPVLGAVGAWRAVVLLLIGLSGFVAWRAVRMQTTDRGQTLGVALLVTVAVAMLSEQGPTAVWRHSPIGAGNVDLSGYTSNERSDHIQTQRRSIRWSVDGVESSVAAQSLTGLAFVINGKVDGHVIGDASTNLFLGLLPTLMHPSARRMLVIGLGTGQTAGWAAASPSVERVDVVELEPAIVDFARACSVTNLEALSSPKLSVHIGDAREWLLSTRESYDVIVSEPSNPYRAGIASLFSEDFYMGAAKRLASDGFFVQWLQGYGLSEETLQTVMATVQAVFPHADVWETTPNGDLVIIASKSPVVHDSVQISERLSRSPWKEGMAKAWGVSGVEGLYASYLGNTSLVQSEAQRVGGRVNSDDHPVIEFQFAWHVGEEVLAIPALRRRAIEGGFDRPLHQAAGEAQWDLGPDSSPLALPASSKVAELRHARAVAWGAVVADQTFAPGPIGARMRARSEWSRGDLEAAAAAWSAQEVSPTQPIDRLIMGEAWAAMGDVRALEQARALEAHTPVEGMLIVARLHQSLGEQAKALTVLRAAFERLQRDPWVRAPTLHRGLSQAVRLAGAGGSEAATALLDVLVTPFAEGVEDEQRRAAALRIAHVAGFEAHCERALSTVEPHPPWHRTVLADRVRCYAPRGDWLARVAEQDLLRFDAQSGG